MGKENFTELSGDELEKMVQRGKQAKSELKRRKEEKREACLLAEEKFGKTSLLEMWRMKRGIPKKKIRKRAGGFRMLEGDPFFDYKERLRKSKGKIERHLCLDELERDTGCSGNHPADES